MIVRVCDVCLAEDKVGHVPGCAGGSYVVVTKDQLRRRMAGERVDTWPTPKKGAKHARRG